MRAIIGIYNLYANCMGGISIPIGLSISNHNFFFKSCRFCIQIERTARNIEKNIWDYHGQCLCYLKLWKFMVSCTIACRRRVFDAISHHIKRKLACYTRPSDMYIFLKAFKVTETFYKPTHCQRREFKNILRHNFWTCSKWHSISMDMLV